MPCKSHKPAGLIAIDRGDLGPTCPWELSCLRSGQSPCQGHRHSASHPWAAHGGGTGVLRAELVPAPARARA